MRFEIVNLLFFTVLLGFSCKMEKDTNHNDMAHMGKPIPFRWEGFEFNDKTYQYGAMFVPVKIDTISQGFEMQFDLGMNVNIIYEKPLETILKEHPSLKENLLTYNNHSVLKTKLQLGEYISPVDSLFLYPDYGSSKPLDSLKIIGSIGANQIDKRVLVIDYKNQTLKILDDITGLDSTAYSFAPLETKKGKLFINLSINNHLYKFLFDTGAGIVPITTTNHDLYNTVTKNGQSNGDTIEATSWDQPIKLMGAEIAMDIKIGNETLNSTGDKCYYTDNTKQVEFFRQIGADGSIGNLFFIENTVVIDLINMRFGAKKG